MAGVYHGNITHNPATVSSTMTEATNSTASVHAARLGCRRRASHASRPTGSSSCKPMGTSRSPTIGSGGQGGGVHAGQARMNVRVRLAAARRVI
jgi:hypothetical protein